jgi:1-aminocyclopropane-1-carboxylate deaminase/D-cysteine desulfhydrase-like pyridoxal-dependent ACC family enzyme
LKHTSLGITQGNVLFPLLYNLYLNALDEFVENLKIEYNEKIYKIKPEYRKDDSIIEWNSKNLKRTNVIRSEEEIKNNLKSIKKDGVRLRELPGAIRTRYKIHYVRWADEWLIGVVGTRKFAEKIQQEVKMFLRETLKLELPNRFTKITALETEYTYFLGHYFSVSTLRQNTST